MAWHRTGTRRLSRPQPGQTLVLVALFLWFVLLGMAAVALDGANYALQRRNLQHVADAAALAGAESFRQTSDAVQARAVAVSYVISNTSPLTVTVANPNVGSGQSLTDGIEINSSGTRVALHRDFQGNFTPLLGIPTLRSAARAHAENIELGGLLPITVKRFDEGRTDVALTAADGDRIDYLDRDGTTFGLSGGTTYSHGWPSPLWAQPDPLTSEANRGPEVAMVGNRANANAPTQSADFNFFVTPDVRQITWPTPVFYHGITAGTTVQTLKNLEADQVLGTGGWQADANNPYPAVMEQLGTFSGANTGTIVDAIRARYRVGDKVVAMLYDGTVYNNPDFGMALSSSSTVNQDLKGKPGEDAPDVAVWHVNLWSATGNFQSQPSGTVLSVEGLSSDYSWSFTGPRVNPGNLVYVTTSDTQSSPLSVNLEVRRATDFAGPETKAFLIKGYDNATGRSHYVGAVVNTWQRTETCDPLPPFTCSVSFSAPTPTFTMYGDNPIQIITQGTNQATWRLRFDSWNGFATPPAVQYAGAAVGTAPPGAVLPSGSVTLSASGGQQHQQVNYTVTGLGGIVGTGQMYRIRVTATDPPHPDAVQDLYLIVNPDTSGGSYVANTTSFVFVLGYARFEITDFRLNTVWRRTVGPLASDPRSLLESMQPRLVAW